MRQPAEEIKFSFKPTKDLLWWVKEFEISKTVFKTYPSVTVRSTDRIEGIGQGTYTGSQQPPRTGGQGSWC